MFILRINFLALHDLRLSKTEILDTKTRQDKKIDFIQLGLHVTQTEKKRQINTFLWGNIRWSEMGEQNIQAKTVYC